MSDDDFDSLLAGLLADKGIHVDSDSERNDGRADRQRGRDFDSRQKDRSPPSRRDRSPPSRGRDLSPPRNRGKRKRQEEEDSPDKRRKTDTKDAPESDNHLEIDFTERPFGFGIKDNGKGVIVADVRKPELKELGLEKGFLVYSVEGKQMNDYEQIVKILKTNECPIKIKFEKFKAERYSRRERREKRRARPSNRR